MLGVKKFTITLTIVEIHPRPTVSLSPQNTLGILQIIFEPITTGKAEGNIIEDIVSASCTGVRTHLASFLHGSRIINYLSLGAYVEGLNEFLLLLI